MQSIYIFICTLNRPVFVLQSFICTFLLDITGTCPCTAAVLYVHYQHSRTVPLLGVWICVDVLEVGFVFLCRGLKRLMRRAVRSVSRGVLHGEMVRKVCMFMYVYTYYT